jgi:hypothetical protein
MRVYVYTCGRERRNYNVDRHLIQPRRVQRDYGCGYCYTCKYTIYKRERIRQVRETLDRRRNIPESPERLIARYWELMFTVRSTINDLAVGMQRGG